MKLSTAHKIQQFFADNGVTRAFVAEQDGEHVVMIPNEHTDDVIVDNDDTVEDLEFLVENGGERDY